MKKITLFLFFVLNFACYSSEFNDNVIIGATVGFNLLPSKKITAGDFQLKQETVPSNIRLPAFIKIKDKWYLHLEYSAIQYSYLIENFSDNDFYLINASDILRDKTSLLIGVAYKFDYKRLRVLPYFDVGLVLGIGYSDEFLLKEKGSNNIRKIENEGKISYSKVDFSFGTDMLFYLGKNGGLMFGIKYDRFKYPNSITSKTSDYYMIDQIKYEKNDFTH